MLKSLRRAAAPAAMLTITACAQISTPPTQVPVERPQVADTSVQAVLDKVIAAYGGDALLSANAIRIESDIRSGSAGQGFTSVFAERFQVRRDAYFDMRGERGSSENWGGRKSAFAYNQRVVTTPEGFGNINYNTGTYGLDAETGFYDSFGGAVRTSDTLLVIELAKRADTAELTGTQNFHGRPHNLLTFEMPNSPTLTLYVDAETGHISQMQRTVGPTVLSYVFNNHKQREGVTYASDFMFLIGPDVTEYTVARSMDVNPNSSGVFTIENSLSAEPETVSTDEMTVDEVAPGVHHVGQNSAYTMFVDAGDHVIGVGGSAGLADRLRAYRADRGSNKPLRYQIATHHHTDHLDSMSDAVAAGAIIMTPEAARANVEASLENPLSDSRIRNIQDGMRLGPVQIHLVSTGHVETFAAAYVPASGVLFQVDHYNNNYMDQASEVNGNGVTFRDAIVAKGVSPNVLLSGHGRKAEQWSDFTAAADAADLSLCQSGRPICADMK